MNYEIIILTPFFKGAADIYNTMLFSPIELERDTVLSKDMPILKCMAKSFVTIYMLSEYKRN
jgi:hypothetical protein